MERSDNSPASDRGSEARQPIRPKERSGLLEPENLARYGAARFEPDPSVASVVDQYWHVQWHLNPSEAIRQRIIDMPLITLTIEDGDVPAPFVITGVQHGVWMRTITGSGTVFAIRLRPAGLAALSGLTPNDVANATVPVTKELDGRLFALLARVAAAKSPEHRTQLADAAIRERIANYRLTAELELANRVFDSLTGPVRARVGLDLAAELGVGERSIQRGLQATLGHGPKWITRRIRLQEVARRLATERDLDLAALAIELGYTDQAHLTNDFGRMVGVSPDAYRRSLSEASG